MSTLTDPLSIAIAELDEDKVMALVQERLQAGVIPLEIVGSLQQGMNEVGLRFESGEYFLSELIDCGETMRQAMEVLEPRLMGANQKHKGNIVVGTVKGDVHDLGKDIVVMLLKGTGYNVIDLGVDVPADRFIAAIEETGAPLVGMSVLLTSCQDAMREIIAAVRASGLNVKILIGGNYVDETVKNHVGADYFGSIASDAVNIADKVFDAQ